ncbi:MAG: hypothetical protein RIK00_05270 [Algiphilus sp.]|uniref:hypothetical protein n=2 Tax=Algiphilus sp. TaxID=1872431 RepID=UPI0032F0572E
MLFRLLNAWRADLVGKLMIALAHRGARNRTVFDRIARSIVSQVFVVPKKDDFMADEFIDNDTGYDLEELRRYQRGE